jgi:glutamate dehydrogenase
MPATPDTLNRLIASVSDTLEPARRALFERFAACLLRGVETHPIGGDRVLAIMAAEAFDWIDRRASNETRVRVRNPEDRPGHTVVEILRDDRPFIVDSLRLELRRCGLHERNVIHPLLPVMRNESGELNKILDARNGTPVESYVYVEVLPALPNDAACEALAASLSEVMQWITELTEDHRRMILAIRELMANLEFAAPALEGGESRVAKVRDFLDWIAEGRFVLVGMRRYQLSEVDGKPEVCIVPSTGLGMWRDDSSSRLFKPRRGDDIPPDILEELEDRRIIFITKSYMESRIHRHGRLDRIMVKEHDDKGRVTGITIIVGLFTGRVLRTPGSQIPLLSERLKLLLDERDVRRGSHRYQSYVAAFDSVPVEMLMGADVEQIASLLEELREASGSNAVRVVTRTSPHGRILYAAVLIPREHYREDLRAGIRQLLVERSGASYIDDRTNFLDEGTAIVHCFCSAAQGARLDPDLVALEESIRTVCAPWEDQLLDALRTVHGDESAPEIVARYETAFSDALRVSTHPMDAVRDVQAIEALVQTGQPQCALWFDQGDEKCETATLRLYLREPPLLSDILPITQQFGIQVVDALLAEVRPSGLAPVAVESLRILPLGPLQRDLDVLRPRLGEALTRTLAGKISGDSLNGLVLGAGLDWRQVDMMRAYLEYFVQIQGTLSRPYLRSVLLENPLAVRVLVRFFEARLDPTISDREGAEQERFLRETFETYRNRIKALNEDRALQGFMDLFEATLRTNYFAPQTTPHRIVFKLDSAKVRELSGVRPHREIFVHSTEFTGIHLRGGAVARGGLRWSDRNDDLRVEVLDLMSTQMLKNGLIVPVGAKGGFVLHNGSHSSSEARAKADEQYRVFIASLLDVTDNLAPDGSIVPPAGVRRLDGDDPYLVVAADKGTAHLSDTANEIALERDFWLGDAFASGGSEGYDHKRYAITARGAWECVKHHFAELGIDPENDDYTAAGIGDMSGDVFGNGLLLARRAKLLAAFDHRHIFLDPEPDPEASWHERKRLFDLPRSSWDDYAKTLISEGGGVWPRGSKSIPVPQALQARLGLQKKHVSGQEMVRAILSMEVDLLWNGGIGTYVKASAESQDEAGDRANDAVRVDASQLRARIIGEGGNLGLTQEARVEAALRGVRLNTDAIDNSAGVDLSDHEVNYKIALAPLVRSGALGAAERRALLFDNVDFACENVLSHNRGQALCVSLDELRALRDPGAFLRAVDALSRYAQIDPDELELPHEGTVMDRAAHGKGFTRPEISVLVGLAKMHAQALLHGSDLLDSPYLEPLYCSYFPERFQEELADSLVDHRLRAEITGLRIVNRLVDAGGATLFDSLCTELGVGVPEAAAAMIQAEDLLRAPEIRERLLEGVEASREGAYRVLLEMDEGTRAVARFLIRSGVSDLDGQRILRWRSVMDVLASSLKAYLSEGETARYQARHQHLLENGVTEDLADTIAALPLADRGLNIIMMCESMEVAPLDAARTYARLGDETGINWIYGRLLQTDISSVWDRVALVDIQWELLDLQRHITERVLGYGSDDLAGAIDRFLTDHASEIERVHELQRSAATSTSATTLAVISARLRCLRAEA